MQDPVLSNPAFHNHTDTRLEHVRLNPFVLHGQTRLPFPDAKGQRQMAHIPLDRVVRHRPDGTDPVCQGSPPQIG